MSRVIQDSDDDLEDEDLEEPFAQAPPKDASMNVNEPSQIPPTEQPGTGSTDSLKRAIETAHRAHFHSGSQPSAPTGLPLQNDLDSPNSLTQRDSKRRKTSTDIAPMKSPVAMSQRKKPLKTYGRSKSVFSSPFLEQVQETEEPRLEQNEAVTENAWNLQGTMRQYYEQHEPMAMFLDPSSTVVDGTMTQQRLMEEVMPPPFLGFQADEAVGLMPQEPAKSSIPWSDFLKSPNTDEQASGGNSGPDDQTHTAGSLAPTPKLSQRSRRGSSVRLKGSPLRNAIVPQDSSEPPLVEDSLGPENLTTVSIEQGLPATIDSTPSASGTRSLGCKKERRKSTIPSQKGNNIEFEGRASNEAPPENRKRQSSPVHTSDDFLETIGLPKEQYKPRPSRSRSLRVLDETPVDYSIAPEKAARRKLKRSKTIAEPQGAAVAPTPQKVRQICDMGFTPSTTQRALKRNHGDVSQTVNWLVNNLSPDMEDELAPPRSSRIKEQQQKKNSTKKSLPSQVADEPHTEILSANNPEQTIPVGANSDTNRVDTETAKEAVIDLVSPSKPMQSQETTKHPKVIIPTPQSKGKTKQPDPEEPLKVTASQKLDLLDGTQSRKPKRRKTTFDNPEPTFEELRSEIPDPEPPKEKKRGRGRPRKAQGPTKSSETITEEAGDDVSSRNPAQEKQEADVLQEKDVNMPAKALSTSKDGDIEDIQETLSASTPPRKTTPAPKEVSKTPQKQLKAGTPHSPLSKGKVTYRVGLSKRARIAPLLRVMKK
ncbi:hypothetical protein BDV96DRAFT_564884 [Lophiotrema nucula]|uniref:UBA domain-containing protein n=1 Tax=Lophiotrema nucula TaxID=690887 RepID=A0A6A5ZN91_9PLEO|nr:hypothetical protein BDV96DRAFT_564884 [Lophiotrema nucula]